MDNLTGPEMLDAALSSLREAEDDLAFHRPLSVPALRTRQERTKYCSQLIRRLGPRYAHCTFQNYEVYEQEASGRPSQSEVAAAVLDFARQLRERSRDGGGIVLFGRPGTGKDHLVAALMFWAVLRHGWTVRWMHGLRLYQDARDVVSGHGSEKRFIEQLVNPQILVLSDPLPPRGDVTTYQAEVVQRILDHRYRFVRPTRTTMNVQDGIEAEERLATPIVDRLRHGALCLRCDWPSYRTLSTTTNETRGANG